MKIEEVVTLYEFLSNCGRLGNLGIWLTLTLLLGATTLWGKEKLNINPRISKTKVFLAIGAVNFIIIGIFNIEAYRRQCILKNANCIKSEFVTYGWKVTGYATMMDASFHCKCDTPSIEAVLDHHPTEFIKVKTDDGDMGIRIIDGPALAAINSYNHEHSSFIKSRILDYMSSHWVDSMSYSEIRLNVNSDFDDEWLEIMLSKYDSIFIPDNLQDDKSRYGDTHFVKLKNGTAASMNSGARINH